MWIRTPDELTALVASLRGCRAIAIDTESDSLYHYREKVCLIQIAGDHGEARLIDTLVLKDLAPLGELLAEPRIAKVVHGAAYDVVSLKRDFGFTLAGLFDTSVAARFLGGEELGLQGLLRTEMGIEISKGGQKDDWSRRPLTANQEAYALADVEHLIELGARLGQRLAAKGRLEWVWEECVALAALPAASRKLDPDAYQRLKGASDLAPRALAVLRELHAWREARADETDLPPFRIAQNTTLLALATAAPQTRDDVLRAPEPRLLARHTTELIAAIARGLAVPEDELPRISHGRRPPPHGAAVRARIDALKAVRAREAARHALDPSILLPQRLLERVAEAAPGAALDTIEGLRRWQHPLVIEALAR